MGLQLQVRLTFPLSYLLYFMLLLCGLYVFIVYTHNIF